MHLSRSIFFVFLALVAIGSPSLHAGSSNAPNFLLVYMDDLGEKNNLAPSMPEKVAEMDKALTAYLEEIDAEDIQEVYQARFEELDRFEEMSKDNFEKNYARLKSAGDTAGMAALKAELDADVERFAKNRKEVKANMGGTHWAGSAPNNH